MNTKIRALAIAGALTATLAGCRSDDASGPPDPGAAPKEWCYATLWIARATQDYSLWQESRPHTRERVETALEYGHSLQTLYQQDKNAGNLPADLSDDDLHAWVFNLVALQDSINDPGQADRTGEAAMQQYVTKVRGACN